MRTRSARDESVVCSVRSTLAFTTHDRHRVVVGRAGRGEVGLGARAGEVGEVGGRADADGLGAALVEPGEVVGLRRQQRDLAVTDHALHRVGREAVLIWRGQREPAELHLPTRTL